MTARPVDVLCVCGFRGVILARAICPSCRASSDKRITSVRMTALRRLVAVSPSGASVPLDPPMRIWLVSHGLATLGPRLAPAHSGFAHGRRLRPLRRCELTDQGRKIVDLGKDLFRIALKEDVSSAV